MPESTIPFVREPASMVIFFPIDICELSTMVAPSSVGSKISKSPGEAAETVERKLPEPESRAFVTRWVAAPAKYGMAKKATAKAIDE